MWMAVIVQKKEGRQSFASVGCCAFVPCMDLYWFNAVEVNINEVLACQIIELTYIYVYVHTHTYTCIPKA